MANTFDANIGDTLPDGVAAIAQEMRKATHAAMKRRYQLLALAQQLGVMALTSDGKASREADTADLAAHGGPPVWGTMYYDTARAIYVAEIEFLLYGTKHMVTVNVSASAGRGALSSAVAEAIAKRTAKVIHAEWFNERIDLLQ